MRIHTRSRCLAVLLAVAMVLSMVPTVAFAADSATWTKVDLAAIQPTDTIAITMTKGDTTWVLPNVGNGSGGQPLAVTAAVSGETLTTDGSGSYAWNLKATDGGYHIMAGENYLYTDAANNGMRIGGTEAVWSVADSGYLTAADTKGTARYLGVYNGQDWRAYNSIHANIAGQELNFWKLSGGSVEPTDPTDPSVPTDPTDPTVPEVVLPPDPTDHDPVDETKVEGALSLKDVYSKTDGDVVTVVGQVAYRLPTNTIFLQDLVEGQIYGFQVYDFTNYASYNPGDVVKVTGTLQLYGGVMQMSCQKGEMTIEVLSTDQEPFPAQELTIAQLLKGGDKYLSEYVVVKDAALGTYNGAGNTPITDETGTLNVFKGAAFPEGVAEGSVVDVHGALSKYNSTYQLRVGQSEDYAVPADDGSLKTGDQVVIFNPAYGKALSSQFTGFYRVGVDMTLNAAGKFDSVADTEIWDVTVEGETYTFSHDGKKLSMDTGYTSMPDDAVNDAWALEPAATEGQFYMKNVGRNCYVEWYADKGSWSGYGSPTEATEGLYALLFVKVDGSSEPPDPTKGPLEPGDQVVIFNPAYGKALSSQFSGFYRVGVGMTLNAAGGFDSAAATEVWDVDLEGDYYTFSNNGKKLSMGASYTSMPDDDVHNTWALEPAAAEGQYYMKNVGRGVYTEYQDSYGTWSGYGAPAADTEGAYALLFVKVDGSAPEVETPKAGDQVVLYNKSSQGVLAGQDDNTESPAIQNAQAERTDGTVTAGNGARVFTVEINDKGEFLFKTEHDGYLTSGETGNSTFYSQQATAYSTWSLEPHNGGFKIMNVAARFNGQYTQYLEYYAGSYKTYSYYNVTDEDIYTFSFYPCADETVGGVVNKPAITFLDLADAYVGLDYTVRFTVDAVFGVKSLEASYTAAEGAKTAQAQEEAGIYSFTIPAGELKGENLTLRVSAVDNKEKSFANQQTVSILDEPRILTVEPARGGQTGENKTPQIAVTYANAGENPTIRLTLTNRSGQTLVDGAAMTGQDGSAVYQVRDALADGLYTAKVTITRADQKTTETTWTFTVGTVQFQLYFGQLHSHTTYSDGAGSVDDALQYVKNLPESANVDFVAFTDHSNYFDSTSAANPEGALWDTGLMTEGSLKTWNEYKSKVAAFNQANAGSLVAIAGFEMTWSGGPGHINTFNSPGLVSRNNKTLNNKTSDAGMKAYYALLSQPEGAQAISQFNHPGSTFGTFSDFSYWDALIDTRINLVEVGNGEGAIGQGGYYPSYEYYIMALDKGWHVAPTNNQDNHKGKWGNANDARDVILTDDFSEAGIYQAMRDLRIYASEDKNLELYYTVNDQMLGSVIEEVPEKLDISVQVLDPDAADSIAKVEVVVNSGKTAYTWDDPAALASGNLSCTLDPEYSYYFIRVTQADGDLAVTAPVWVGETIKLGISSLACGTSTPVTGEALELTTTLFNSESTPATISSITYTTDGAVILDSFQNVGEIPAAGSYEHVFQYTPTQAKVTTITATVVLELEGKELTFTKSIDLDVLDAEKLVYVGIDASHYNEYVAGNYADSMGNFGKLAAEYGVRTVELKTGADLIAACSNPKYKALILTVPSRRDGIALRDPYATYSDGEIAAIVNFSAAGGAVVLTGWSDYYESYESFPAEDHMAAQQNKLLTALGSKLRIADDGILDDSLNGGQPQRLYFSTYNLDSFLLDGVEFDPDNPNNNLYSQLFSHYGGASIYAVDESGQPTATLPAGVTPVVYGHATTYSKDQDSDGLGGDSVPKYQVSEGDSRLLALGTEEITRSNGVKSLVVVSGAAFMSNFEVQATVEDSGAEKNYSNYNICENLLALINPLTITPIEEVQAEPNEKVKFTVEGVVTSNASGYDKDTAFFDCIYVQDDTAGINAFPVAGEYQIGDRVRISGTTSSYQGERQLAVSSITLLGHGEAPAPKPITASQLNDGSVLGSLVTIQGTVQSFELAEGLVQTILVKDEAGETARIFIDGYITTSKEVENLEVGAAITATGLASYDNTFNAPDGPFPRIRIRDRADVVCTESHTHDWSDWVVVTPATCTEDGLEKRTCSVCGEEETRVIPKGHSYEIVVVPPTCTEDGYTQYTCKVCGYNYRMDYVPALGHDYQAVVTAPTCTEGGYTTYTCTRGDDSYVADRVPALGHTWGDWTVTKPADCRSEGEEARTCPVCQETQTRVIPANQDACPSKQFVDVNEKLWYHEGVDYVLQTGLMIGTSERTFSPNGPLTRGQLMVILYRLAGSPAVEAETPFTDVQAGTYYADAVAWAYEAGIAKGVSQTRFAPNQGVSREQLVTFFARYTVWTGNVVAAVGDLRGFEDADRVSAYAQEAMTWAVENGLIEGTGENLLAPGHGSTRAQAATILLRYCTVLEFTPAE